ncbi:hypothetical protein GHK50_05515 [Sinorhizobium medicae]|uniref:Uncharacterized protein n=1 Tax=Sinorhizobium medicae TaxID=110321 RepID=A0A6G1WR07_9HYPH|nr:hypothetical protein [Sinorhizobium medicae]MQW72164.1 hypothetical protein [Sinorhizobium medicae]MQX82572.1 hypothetical protein [Sinorhizobium medicae]
MPDNGAFLWDWFWELRQAQPPGFSGPVPISNVEVSVWCQLTGNIIRREELAILRAMDARFCIEIEAESEAIRERDDDLACRPTDRRRKRKLACVSK